MREMIFMREMISTLLLALSLVLSLAACGGSAPPGSAGYRPGGLLR